MAIAVLDEATTYTSSELCSPSMTDDCQKAIATLRQALAAPPESVAAVPDRPMAEAAKFVKGLVADLGFNIWSEDGNTVEGIRAPNSDTCSYAQFMEAADWLVKNGFADWDASGRVEHLHFHEIAAAPPATAREPLDGWISVAERLPGDWVNMVLVADKFGNVGTGELYPDGIWDCSIEIIDGDCPGYITHWQPLPAPPLSNTKE